jgi:hypothetical protein
VADRPYSGYATRSAHFARHVSVPGVNADHTRPNPEPDPFSPQPETPANQAHTVWDDSGGDPARQSGVPNFAQVPVNHWYAGQPAVASGVPYGQAQQAMQERLMADHSATNYVPDSIRLYQHWSEGQRYEWVVGRASQYAGSELPDGPLAALQNGTNAYDKTNPANEVYAGDPANVGRYRLGVKSNIFGLYESPLGKFGQDAELRAIEGLTPALPYAKPRMRNTAPYTPSSTGTAHWAPAPPYQTPSTFALPGETSVTDYRSGATVTGSDFEDGDRL